MYRDLSKSANHKAAIMPRRAAAASARSKLAANAKDDEGIDSEGEQRKPSSRSSRASPPVSSGKAPSSSSSTGSSVQGGAKGRRTVAAKRQQVKQDEEEEEDASLDAEDDEVSENEEEEEEEEEALPKRAPRGKGVQSRVVSATKSAKPAVQKRSKRAPVVDSDDEDEEEEAAQGVEESQDSADVSGTSKAEASTEQIAPSQTTKSPADQVDEEEEKDASGSEEDGDETQTQVKTPESRPATLAPAQASAPAVPAGPKTRLTIHKMVLQDFKSYAGRQEIGPFHKSFSAVVGPNGSGKSNVIDALLFVFGWRANKMRQGKLGELIHNSAGKENLPNCTVEVWFREIEDLVSRVTRLVLAAVC